MTVETRHEQAHENAAVLRLGAGPLAAPTLARVVAMMLARAGCPLDRLDDAMLICDALSAHASENASDGQVQFTVLTHNRGLELRVGALTPDGARRLVEQSALPGIGSVLEPIADNVRIEPSNDGHDDELVLDLVFSPVLSAEQSG